MSLVDDSRDDERRTVFVEDEHITIVVSVDNRASTGEIVDSLEDLQKELLGDSISTLGGDSHEL